MKPSHQQHLGGTLWDLFCAISIFGIWPRYIEPNLLSTTNLSLSIPNLPEELNGLHIVQFSDLHLHDKVTDLFLNKLSHTIANLKPDILVFTGDFLCYSKLLQKERLLSFLNRFHALYGCYTILGNHDYEKSVSINEKGEYDIVAPVDNLVKKGLQMLMHKTKLTGTVTERARQVAPHKELLALLSQTPFQLLHNKTVSLSIKGKTVNICGLGEYTLGKTIPDVAIRHYDTASPGIILTHNPDSMRLLQNNPGNVILSGHTHGGQINLPFIWNRFTAMEVPQYKRGLFKVNDKWLYVSRGTGSVVPFRFASIPEVVSIKLGAEQ